MRERAEALLSACLDIIKSRDRSPDDMYRKLFLEARNGLGKATQSVPVDTVLGSLLAFAAMLENQQLVRSSKVDLTLCTDQKRRSPTSMWLFARTLSVSRITHKLRSEERSLVSFPKWPPSTARHLRPSS